MGKIPRFGKVAFSLFSSVFPAAPILKTYFELKLARHIDEAREISF